MSVKHCVKNATSQTNDEFMTVKCNIEVFKMELYVGIEFVVQ